MQKENPFYKLSEEEKQAHFLQLNDYKEMLRQNPQLRSLFIEMTLDCNEHCLHCGSRAGDLKGHNSLCSKKADGDLNPGTEMQKHPEYTEPLTDEEILVTLKRLKRDLTRAGQPLPFLNITGGEPMLRSHLPELMSQIHDLGYRWGMTSNGLLITEDAASRLKAAGMYSVSISLDGMEEDHDWFRRHKGGWKKALEAVDHLISAGIEEVMITTVVNRRNKDQLDQVKEIIKAHHCRLWRIINIDPIGRALDHPELLLTRNDYRNMIDYIVSLQEDPDMSVIYTCNYYLGPELEGKVRPWYYFCRAGLQLAAIQYNGDIGACLDIERRPELVFGNVRRDNLYKVWRKGFGIYREHKEEKSKKCRLCRHKDNCQGNGWHTWNFDTDEPRICMLEELGEEIP